MYDQSRDEIAVAKTMLTGKPWNLTGACLLAVGLGSGCDADDMEDGYDATESFAELESELASDPELETVSGLLRDFADQTLSPNNEITVSQNLQADQDLGLILRLQTSPEGLFEMYEPTPGYLLISTVSRDPVSAQRNRELYQLPLDALWAQYAAGAPMPARISEIAAEYRDQPLAALAPDLKLEHPTTQFENHPESTNANYGRHNYCTSNYFGDWYSGCSPVWSYRKCINNRVGDYSSQHEDLRQFTANVCTVSGRVRLSIWSNEFVGGGWWVNTGALRSWSGIDNSCASSFFDDCATVRVSARYASGDTYHYRFLGIIEWSGTPEMPSADSTE